MDSKGILFILQRYMLGDTEDHRNLFDLIEKMLEYEPSMRCNLEDAYKHPFFDKLTPQQKGLLGAPGSSDDDRARSHSLSR